MRIARCYESVSKEDCAGGIIVIKCLVPLKIESTGEGLLAAAYGRTAKGVPRESCRERRRAEDAGMEAERTE